MEEPACEKYSHTDTGLQSSTTATTVCYNDPENVISLLHKNAVMLVWGWIRIQFFHVQPSWSNNKCTILSHCLTELYLIALPTAEEPIIISYIYIIIVVRLCVRVSVTENVCTSRKWT